MSQTRSRAIVNVPQLAGSYRKIFACRFRPIVQVKSLKLPLLTYLSVEDPRTATMSPLMKRFCQSNNSQDSMCSFYSFISFSTPSIPLPRSPSSSLLSLLSLGPSSFLLLSRIPVGKQDLTVSGQLYSGRRALGEDRPLQDVRQQDEHRSSYFADDQKVFRQDKQVKESPVCLDHISLIDSLHLLPRHRS